MCARMYLLGFVCLCGSMCVGVYSMYELYVFLIIVYAFVYGWLINLYGFCVYVGPCAVMPGCHFCIGCECMVACIYIFIIYTMIRMYVRMCVCMICVFDYMCVCVCVGVLRDCMRGYITIMCVCVHVITH